MTIFQKNKNMATFVLKRIFEEKTFSKSRGDIIKDIANNEGNLVSHLLMYLTVDLSSNKDNKIAHWSDSEIPEFTVGAAQGFNHNKWNMMKFKFLFPTFLGPRPLDYKKGAVYDALLKLANECNNQDVWKYLLSDEYKLVLEKYVNSLDNLMKTLHRVPDNLEVIPIIEKLRESEKLYNDYPWASYQHNSSNRLSSEKNENVKLIKSKKWNPY